LRYDKEYLCFFFVCFAVCVNSISVVSSCGASIVCKESGVDFGTNQNYRTRATCGNAIGEEKGLANNQTMSLSSQEGFSNLDFPQEAEQFIPSPATHLQRAYRRAHVISFCGGVVVGIFALLSVQWTLAFF
jgi:hypothetical protein